jgi:hypothetical protein
VFISILSIDICPHLIQESWLGMLGVWANSPYPIWNLRRVHDGLGPSCAINSFCHNSLSHCMSS